MNAGKDFGKAIEQAKANAARTGTPRWVHSYNGTFWISQTPLRCGHWLVMPNGDVRDIDESMAEHVYRLRTEPAYAAQCEAEGQAIMDLLPKE